MSETQATVEKPFEDDEGWHEPGDSITVTKGRFAELKANGLVSGGGDVSAETKVAPASENKMLPEPKQATGDILTPARSTKGKEA